MYIVKVTVGSKVGRHFLWCRDGYGTRECREALEQKKML